MRILSNFYTVHTQGGELLECRPRGILRLREQAPLVGDIVTLDTSESTPVIDTVETRRNALLRPPAANVDQIVVVISTVLPAPNLLVVDKLIATAENEDIEPVVVVTKIDAQPDDGVAGIYRSAGFRTAAVSNETGQGIDEVMALLRGKVSVLSGNSGAGKTSLLNRLSPALGLAVGDVSEKLGRGRHTTRHTELFELEPGTLVADTPGFSSIDLVGETPILRDNLRLLFREFEPYEGRCRFHDCTHVSEPGCAVLEALESGDIAPSRHRSYATMFSEAGEIKEWELDTKKPPRR